MGKSIPFEINLLDTFTRVEKYSSKLDISRSFICIFVINREDTFARWEKYSSKLDIFSLAYAYLCGSNVVA